MLPTTALRARTPLINFIGRRTIPQNLDHTPRAHPASPTGTLPNSFAEYRKAAQQHGPLMSTRAASIEPSNGEFFDRSQLPRRFWRMAITREEMEIIESGGAAGFA